MDDKFWRNRKVRALRQTRAGREALGAWAFWWSWCLDDPALDGVLPKSELPKFDRRSAELLAEQGLWDDLGESYQVHDFHEYNPTRGQVEHKREADRTRIAAERAAFRRVSERVSVERESRATSARLASARDPDPDPDPGPSLDLDPPDLFPRASAPEGEGEEMVRIGAEEPQAPAQAAAAGPEPAQGASAPATPTPSQQRAARAAWTGNGLSCLELDDLTVLDGEPPENEQGPIRVIRPLDDDPRGFDHRVRNRFQKLYEDRFDELPNMGGPSGATFPERLAKTAEARGIDPFELLTNTFEVFARLPRDDIASSHPYATFAARFGRYLNKPAAKALSRKDRLKQEIAEALAKGDRALYSELDAQFRAEFLGGRDARPAV